MLDIKQKVWEKAIGITKKFEGGVDIDPYTTLVGNFDGAFLSYGFLQWNFLSNTLQPIFLRLFREFPEIARDILPNGGRDLLDALNKKTEKQWALTIQKNNRVVEPWLSALRKLGTIPQFRKIQDDAAKWYRDGAIKLCQQFNLTTDRAYCLFFDIMVQNGGIRFYEISEKDYFEKLKSIANTAANKANPRWKNDVLARKMTIATGIGTVHGRKYNLQFTDTNAIINLDNETINAIDNLIKNNIITNKQLLIDNASKSDTVDGKYAAKLINRLASSIAQKNIEDLNSAIDIFVQYNITKSKDYWLKNANDNGVVSGEYITTIIKRTSPLLKPIVDFELSDAIDILINKKILSNRDYWFNNSIKGGVIRGKYAGILFTRLATNISRNEVNINDAIKILHNNEIISDQNYWLNNINNDSNINGEFMAIVIKRIAKILK